jgi:hypothetical protein
MEVDELDTLIAKRAAQNPAIPAMVEEECRKRALKSAQCQQPMPVTDEVEASAQADGIAPLKRTASGGRRHQRPSSLHRA